MTMRMLLTAPAILAGFIAANSAAAVAATATHNIGVSITIQAECLFTSAADIDFGTQGVLSAATPARSTIVVQCTATTPYDIGLNAGRGTGATVATPPPGGQLTPSPGIYQDTVVATVT
jgi:spore coat protein U-like protein